MRTYRVLSVGIGLLLIFSCSHQGQGQECTEHDVRLVDGVFGDFEGRLEVCFNGRWGTVCNDDWDVNDAMVVCRQLNATSKEELSNVITGIHFGSGSSSQSIHFTDVACVGNEERLTDCPLLNYPSPMRWCLRSEDVGSHPKQQECTDGEVRLVDGAKPTEGRVEFCVGGRWGTVCSGRFSLNKWKDHDVQVVCRQLGHTVIEPTILSSVPQPGDPRTPIVLNNINCTGEENDLGSCQTTIVEGCEHTDDVGANCTRTIECNDTDVRLVGGSNEDEGRVEFCQNGLWGVVCNNSWDEDDARVVCRELGYNVENETIRTSLDFDHQANIRRIWLNQVQCVGNETNLAQCSHSTDSSHCTHPGAGVFCHQSTTDLDYTTTDPPMEIGNYTTTDPPTELRIDNTGPSEIPRPTSDVSVSAIVGGVVGGLIIAILIAILVILIVRTRWKLLWNEQSTVTPDHLYDNPHEVKETRLGPALPPRPVTNTGLNPAYHAHSERDRVLEGTLTDLDSESPYDCVDHHQSITPRAAPYLTY